MGIKKRVRTHGLTDEAFTTLRAGASLSISLDASHAHDLDAGSTYSISSTGRIPFALHGSNTLVGSVGFSSNDLALTLGPDALVRRSPDVLRDLRDHRPTANFASDCPADRLRMAQEANTLCASIANLAAQSAATDDARFQHFFATLDGGSRRTVIARLHAVAAECAQFGKGSTRTDCKDYTGDCTPNTLAYTFPDTGFVVDCSLYFDLPPVESACHMQDRATTTIHEYTHSK
jgi:deuterolysin